MPFTKPVVVIDNGSYNIKAGFSCDNHPVSIFRTTVGRPKYLKGTYGKTPYEVYIGDQALERISELDLNYPVSKGKICHWDNMERVWHHIFYKELKSAPEDRAVLLSCSPATTMQDKVKCCEVFFETLNVPALCIKPQSVLSLFGSGCTTGLSVDLGHDVTEINPIYEGGSIGYANIVTNVAAAEVSNYIQASMRKRGVSLGKFPKETMQKIMYQYLYITPNCTVTRGTQAEYKKQFTLPSGEVIDVSDEVFCASEMYFQPELITSSQLDLLKGQKKQYMSLQEAIVTSVAKCDPGLYSDMYDAIVVHGGLATMPGLGKRLSQEVTALINRPVHALYSSEAYAVAWLGGAVLSTLKDARKVWVMKKQFDEQGERIIRYRFEAC